jgi:hypothetical protein
MYIPQGILGSTIGAGIILYVSQVVINTALFSPVVLSAFLSKKTTVSGSTKN